MARRTPKKPKKEKKKRPGQPETGEKKAKAWPKAVWIEKARKFDAAGNEHYRQAERLYRDLLEAGSDTKKGLQYMTMIEGHLKRLKAAGNEKGIAAFLSYYLAVGVEASSLIETLLRTAGLQEWAQRIPLPKRKKKKGR